VAAAETYEVSSVTQVRRFGGQLVADTVYTGYAGSTPVPITDHFTFGKDGVAQCNMALLHMLVQGAYERAKSDDWTLSEFKKEIAEALPDNE